MDAILSSKTRTDAGGLGLGGTSPSSDASNNVRVCLRVRPLLPFEKNAGDSVNASVLPDDRTVRLTSNQATYNQQVEAHQYRLDQCFGPSVNQQDFFHGSGVEAFCDSALEGQAATVFCFGQTGSGKTFTMSGPHLADDIDQYFSRELKRKEGIALGGGYEDGEDHQDVHMETAGLQYRGVHYIANAAAKANAQILQNLADLGEDTNFTPITVRASYLEIYQENVNDLLNETEGLKVRWAQGAQSFFVENLLIVTCDDIGDLMAVLAQGGGNRKRAAHKLNVDSSRSHVLFTLYIERKERADAPAKYGKINFVDLAGSEKLKDSESTGVNADETKSINTSLFTLGKVIAALSKRRVIQNKSGPVGGLQAEEEIFVPYRDSSLTKLLMDSLGGSCRTLMIACISPAYRFTDESIRTIKYAMRTRNIVNAIPSVRMDPGQRQVFELKQEVALLKKENIKLREELALFRAGVGAAGLSHVSSGGHSPATSSMGGGTPGVTNVDSYRIGGVGGGAMPDSAPSGNGGASRLPNIHQRNNNNSALAPHTTTYIEEDALDNSISKGPANNSGQRGGGGGGARGGPVVSPHKPSGNPPHQGTSATTAHATPSRKKGGGGDGAAPLPPLSPPPPSIQSSHPRGGGVTSNQRKTRSPSPGGAQRDGGGDTTEDEDGTIVVGGAAPEVDPSTFSNRRQLGGRLPKQPVGTSTTVLPQQRKQQFPVTQDQIHLDNTNTSMDTPEDEEENIRRQSQISDETPHYNNNNLGIRQRMSSNSSTNAPHTTGGDSRRPSSITGSDTEGGGGGGTRNTAGAALNPDGSVATAAWSNQPTATAKEVSKKFGFKPAKKK